MNGEGAVRVGQNSRGAVRVGQYCHWGSAVIFLLLTLLTLLPPMLFFIYAMLSQGKIIKKLLKFERRENLLQIGKELLIFY